ncbi:MAG TPA: DUF6152 family protein, partial [Gammaproteobacteria bacterium]
SAMKRCLTIVAAASAATGASAHHSDAGIDMDSIVAFEGVVTEFHYRNPHVYVLVDVENEAGETVEWDFQMGPVSVISRRGWERGSLVPGDRVIIRGHPSRDGRPYAILESIDKEGGLLLGTAPEPPDIVPPATSIEGKWLADRGATMDYPGGFDGFFLAQLELTDAGRAAMEAYDPLSAENPESTCVGRPTPAALVSSSLYLMEIGVDEGAEIITIRSEYFDEERTIYMDGRDHPDPGERFVTGHSIGRWDGDTLIVDTRNFADHRSPYQIGVPSGAQKHVVETYRLSDDGTDIELTFMLEDPEYIAEPMNHSRLLHHSPHLEMYLGGCDPDATSRFVAP